MPIQIGDSYQREDRLALLHLHAQEERGRRTFRRDNCLCLAVGSTFKCYGQAIGRERGFVQFRRAFYAQRIRQPCRRAYFHPGDVNDEVKRPRRRPVYANFTW